MRKDRQGRLREGVLARRQQLVEPSAVRGRGGGVGGHGVGEQNSRHHQLGLEQVTHLDHPPWGQAGQEAGPNSAPQLKWLPRPLQCNSNIGVPLCGGVERSARKWA